MMLKPAYFYMNGMYMNGMYMNGMALHDVLNAFYYKSPECLKCPVKSRLSTKIKIKPKLGFPAEAVLAIVKITQVATVSSGKCLSSARR